MESPFKIQILRQLASFALDSTDYQPGDSARVRAVPDVRTIRYYTTLGLIDRPAEMRGRTAMYGLRHVEQLVAIKRLQAGGMTLSDIQRCVVGIPAKELSKLAKLPKNLLKKFAAVEAMLSEQSEAIEADASTLPQASKELWRQTPRSRSAPVSPASAGVKQVVRLPLGAGVSIEIEVTDNEANQLDLNEIAKSARTLLREVQRQRKLINQHEGEASQ